MSKNKMNPKACIAAFPKDMNGTERSYADLLNLRVKTGEILRWDFEPEKLKLAKNTYYTPDFRVITQQEEIEFHEVKGFWRDDARVKIKVAAATHPYRFIAVQKKKGIWMYETF